MGHRLILCRISNEAGAITKTEDASLITDAARFCFLGNRRRYCENVRISTCIKKYHYHLALYNRFASLIRLTEEPEPDFEVLLNVRTVGAQDVNLSSRMFHYRYKIAKFKKDNQGISHAEKNMSERSLLQADNQDEIWNAYNCIQDNKDTLRDFYQSLRINSWSMRREKFGKKARDQIFSRECQWLNPAKKKRQMDDPKVRRKNLSKVPSNW